MKNGCSFQTGDLVRRTTDSWTPEFFGVKGQIYRVLATGRGTIEIIAGRKANACEFELVQRAEPPSGPAIVCLIKNGVPKPNAAPKVHPDVDRATTEAERLARLFPDQEFAVFEMKARRQATVLMNTFPT